MTNEDFDRKVEFLLNQQARFYAGMQQLQEAQAINDKKIGEVAATAAHAVDAVLHVAESVTKLAKTVTDLTTTTHEGFRLVFDSMKKTDERIDLLVNSQIHTDKSLRDTDKRLRNLTDLFERYIRDGRGGRNGSDN